jgi:hypothetical protein
VAGPPTPAQIEYRRRRSRIARVVVLFSLVPFGLLALLSRASAPPVVLSVGMALTFGGVLFSAVYVWRVWACPVCGFKLWNNGTLGGQCLGCKTQLYIPRRSKSGRVYP